MILFRSLWAGDSKVLDAAIDCLGNHHGLLRMKSSERMRMPLLHGAAYIHTTLQQAGPRAYRELMWGALPVRLFARTASLLPFLPRKQRGIAAMSALVMLATGIGLVNERPGV